MKEKPYKGRISEWRIIDIKDFAIVNGRFMDHERFAGRRGHTSAIVAYNEATGEVETENSRYKLEGEAEGPRMTFQALMQEQYGGIIRGLEAQGIKVIGDIEGWPF